MHFGLTMIPLVTVAALVACVPTTATTGAGIYPENCVMCHGKTGAGDGPIAADLPVSPANLRNLSASNGGTFPAERVMAAIYGYRGKDYQGLMPEFGPVLDSPVVGWKAPDGQVIQTPSDLVDLAEYLETLQDQ